MVSCSTEKKESEFKTKDKAPDSLAKLASGIDDMLKTLSDIERLTLDIPIPEKNNEEEQPPENESANIKPEKEGQGQGKGNQGEQGQGQGNQGEQSNQSGSSEGTKIEDTKSSEQGNKEEQTKKQWESIEKKLEEIHPLWNSYEAESLKKGATMNSANKFKEPFNKMTKAVEEKDILEIYNNASLSLLNLKAFFDLYLDDIGGDVSALKYSAYQGYYRAVQGGLKGAEEVLSNQEENINRIRLKLTKEEEKQKTEKVSLSLADFKGSLEENSRRLFMIKKDIIIENLRELEN